ncbi:MAG: tryptophan--tRNA ligase [Bacteroidales bacterium]|nr:tryptophan--tRNA ligase [Bacteroidales bacterium]
MKTVLSGIRPTGDLHLGNYIGALRNFVEMQHQYNCYFFIADFHSLTTHPTPENIQGNVRSVLAQYIACGLDPEKATIYIQSDVPEVIELYLYLNMNAYLGELERCSSFKEKIRQHPDNVNAGLLTYPTLMAADILIHKANFVPVGKDQEQHLEMARTFGNRFNRMYGEDYFPEPQAFNFGKELVKIPALNGAGKMGKSEGESSTIFLTDTPKQIEKKVKRAVTDAGPTEPNSPMSEPIANLFQLMNVVSEPDTIVFFKEKYNDCSIRYGDLKKQLAEDMIAFVNPIREKIEAVMADEKNLNRVAEMGKEKAKASAGKTIREVRELIGFKPY